jgi:uncharacterized protein YndB with AHSA1/START domain
VNAGSVNASVFVEAPPERVYEYFTRPEAMVRWMGDFALLEARPGGRFTVDVKGVPIRGRYLELEPPHRLLISFGYAGSERLAPGASTVEVRLIADRGGTRVELEHRDLPSEEIRPHAVGWDHYLSRLQADARDGSAGPDQGMPSGDFFPARSGKTTV